MEIDESMQSFKHVSLRVPIFVQPAPCALCIITWALEACAHACTNNSLTSIHVPLFGAASTCLS